MMQLGYPNPKIRFGLHPLAPERDPIWVSWSLGSGELVFHVLEVFQFVFESPVRSIKR